MTMATCLRCGASKWGALAPCAACKFLPESSEDKAKSMVLSDHFLSAEDLRKLGERIRTGQHVGFPEDVVADYVERIEAGAGALSPGEKFLRWGKFLAGIAFLGWIIYRLL